MGHCPFCGRSRGTPQAFRNKAQGWRLNAYRWKAFRLIHNLNAVASPVGKNDARVLGQRMRSQHLLKKRPADALAVPTPQALQSEQTTFSQTPLLRWPQSVLP